MGENRVTHVSFSSLGGAGAVAARLRAGQRRLGWRADLVTLVDTPFPRWAARHPCVALGALADYYLVRRSGRAAFFSLLRRRHATGVARRLAACGGVLHLHWLPGFLRPETLLSRSLQARRLVWSVHDLWPLTGGCHYANGCEEFQRDCRGCPQVRAPFRRSVAAALRRKRAGFEARRDLRIVVPSQWARTQVEVSSATRDLAVAVIPNPVDTEVFAPADRVALRAKWGLDPAAFVVGVGAADLGDERKQIPQTLALLDDWIRSRGPVPAVQVLVFGAGRPTPGLAPAFRFMGPSEGAVTLAEWYNTMDAHVSLSRFETFGNTLAEAAACATPCVCLARSGTADVVVDGVTGRQIEAPEELPAMLTDWAAHPAQARAMGQAAHADAVARFNDGVVARQFINLYQQPL